MEYEELADALLAAIEAGDADRVRSLYHEDACIWHNFDEIEQTVDENLETLAWLIREMPERNYDVVRREALPDGFMQQHVLRGTTRTGKPLAMPACIICRIRDGRIARIDEYLDMAGASALVA